MKRIGWLISGGLVIAETIVAGLVLFQAEPVPIRDIVGTEQKRYSQFNEEIVVRDFFQDQTNGFFLDIGCA